MSIKSGSGLLIKSLSASGLSNGFFTGMSVRPQGYQYPIGLSARVAGQNVTNAATNSTGGTKTIDGTNGVHTFTVSGTFTPSFTGNVEILVVAGGGGGGNFGGAPGERGGGGGAGGYRYLSGQNVTSNSPYTITIGAGGSASSNGDNSVFGSITSLGGGRGGERSPGFSGGSGGGAGGGVPPVTGGSGTPGQGNPGGSVTAGGGGGGGGGAGSAGSGTPGDSLFGGPGGSGVNSAISGTSTAYAGGGGGWQNGIGGSSIGGSGVDSGAPATSGVANRGSGGGGSGTGGSGIVIVRYVLNQFVEAEYIIN